MNTVLFVKGSLQLGGEYQAQFGLRYVAGMHNTGCKVFEYKKFVKCDTMINNYFFDLIFLPYLNLL